MTLEQHRRALGALHLLFGGVQTLVTLLVVGFIWLVLGGTFGAPPPPGGEVPPVFFWGVMTFVVLLQALLTLPSFVAGYAILKRRPWAKSAGVAASVVEALSFPHGTALSVYSLWFLLGQYDKLEEQRAGWSPGRRGSLYGTLPPPHTDWAAGATRRGREREYVPPPQPPDWRGDS